MADVVIEVEEPIFRTLAAMKRCWTGERYAVFGANGFKLRGHVFERRTLDVDVTVAINADDLSRLRDSLTPAGWRHVERQPHRWRHDGEGLEADVIPIGETAGRETSDLGHGLLLDVRGLELAIASAEAITIKRGENTSTAPVPPVPVLVLLKMIANRDKPLHREKDAVDVGVVARAYLPSESERYWEAPCTEIYEFELKSPCALGFDVGHQVGRYRPVVEAFWNDQRVHGHVQERGPFGWVPPVTGDQIAGAFLHGFKRALADGSA